MSTKKISENTLFVERLVSLRGDRNKAEFSRFLGLKPPVYQAYENGRIPSADNLSLIASKCGMSVDWLLGHTESKDAPGKAGVSPQENHLASRRREIEIEQAQISIQIGERMSECEHLRKRYSELSEEYVDILVKTGVARRFSQAEADEKLAQSHVGAKEHNRQLAAKNAGTTIPEAPHDNP